MFKMQHGSTKCDACGTVTSAALQRCSRCHKATYCDRDCQKAHWAKHKVVCHPPNNNRRFITAGPQSKDFPPPLNCFEFVKSSDDLHENILILLHGLGDTHNNYSRLAITMKLPQTCCISLRAPLELPLDCGYAWFPAFNDDGSLIEGQEEERRRVKGLKATRRQLHSFIDTLKTKFEWPSERIFLLGFSQGGVVAVDAVIHYPSRLGGAIAISSSMLPEKLMRAAKKKGGQPNTTRAPTTPLLITHGTEDKVVSLREAQKAIHYLQQLYSNNNKGGKGDGGEEEPYVIFKAIEGKGHSMISSSSEMYEVMQFLSKRMYLRSVALETAPGVIEIH